ncbi:MAG: TlpA disulfide reductase family protein [Trueperaceae bacterium]|nr:TlpA disulfide reductase family protein [Trueperaceae bacterium]
MTGIALGPVVLSAPRLSVALALLVLVLVAEGLERFRGTPLSGWAWNSALVAVIGARLGFVGTQLSSFLAEPLSIFYIWQGGFDPVIGVAAAAAYTFWHFRRSSRHFAWALLPAGAALLMWGGAWSLTTPTADERVEQIPEVRLQTLGGADIDTTEALTRPTVINLWATWCPPCRREMPLLSEMAAERPDIAFWLVNQAEGAATVARYVEEEGLEPTLIYLDPQSRLGAASRSRGLPTTLFVAADGTIVARHLGELSRPLLESYLAQLPTSDAYRKR